MLPKSDLKPNTQKSQGSYSTAGCWSVSELLPENPWLRSSSPRTFVSGIFDIRGRPILYDGVEVVVGLVCFQWPPYQSQLDKGECLTGTSFPEL